MDVFKGEDGYPGYLEFATDNGDENLTRTRVLAAAVKQKESTKLRQM